MAEPFDVNQFIDNSVALGARTSTGSVAQQTSQISAILVGQNANDAAASGALAKDLVSQAQATKQLELEKSMILQAKDQQFKLDQAKVYEGSEKNKQEQFRIASELDNIALENERLKEEAQDSWNPLTKVMNGIRVAGNKAKEQNLLGTGISLAETQTARSAALTQNITAYNAGTVIPALHEASLGYNQKNSQLQVEEISAALTTIRGSNTVTNRNNQQNLANAGSLSQEQRAQEASARAAESHKIAMEQAKIALAAAKANDPRVLNPTIAAYQVLAGVDDSPQSRSLSQTAVLTLAQKDPEGYLAMQRLGLAHEQARQRGVPITRDSMQTILLGLPPAVSSRLFKATGADTFAGPLATTALKVKTELAEVALSKYVAKGKTPTPAQQKQALADAEAQLGQMTAGQMVGKVVNNYTTNPAAVQDVGALAEPAGLQATFNALVNSGRMTPQETAVIQAPQFKTILASPMPNDITAPMRRSMDIMDFAIKTQGMDVGAAAQLTAKLFRERASMQIRSNPVVELGASLGIDVSPKKVMSGYNVDKSFMAGAVQGTISAGISARAALGFPLDPETVAQLTNIVEGNSVNVVNAEDLVLHYGRQKRAEEKSK